MKSKQENVFYCGKMCRNRFACWFEIIFEFCELRISFFDLHSKNGMKGGIAENMFLVFKDCWFDALWCKLPYSDYWKCKIDWFAKLAWTLSIIIFKEVLFSFIVLSCLYWCKSWAASLFSNHAIGLAERHATIVLKPDPTSFWVWELVHKLFS